MEELWQRYTPASRRLVDALFEGRDPDGADVATVRQVLHVYLGGFGLDGDARDDVIQDTLLLLVSGVRRGIVDRRANLAAFIRTIALNRVRDAGRYRARRPVLTVEQLPEPATDDAIARLIDELSSADDVNAALAAAIEDDELELATFISDWLLIAERLGAAPSLRQAAELLGTNHMHVQRGLERFGVYLHRVRR